MNRTRKALAAIGVVATVAALVPSATSALAGDPVVTAVCDATVVVNTPVHCTVSIDLPGFAPSNPRITYRSRTGRTLDVANSSVIPVTFDGAVWRYTYTPDASEAGRTEVFSVTVPVSAARIPRTVSGAAAFTVVAS